MPLDLTGGVGGELASLQGPTQVLGDTLIKLVRHYNPGVTIHTPNVDGISIDAPLNTAEQLLETLRSINSAASHGKHLLMSNVSALDRGFSGELNHYVGLIIENNHAGGFKIQYIDPMGREIDSAINEVIIAKLGSAVTETYNSRLQFADVVLDRTAAEPVRRFNGNDHDCGPMLAYLMTRAVHGEALSGLSGASSASESVEIGKALRKAFEDENGQEFDEARSIRNLEQKVTEAREAGASTSAVPLLRAGVARAAGGAGAGAGANAVLSRPAAGGVGAPMSQAVLQRARIIARGALASVALISRVRVAGDTDLAAKGATIAILASGKDKASAIDTLVEGTHSPTEWQEKLKKRYQEIFQALRKIHVCKASFELVIDEIGIETGGTTYLLKNQLSFYDATTPLRIQLKDLSSIAANGLSHHLAFLWAEGSDLFGMNNYKNVFVITRGYLKGNPDKTKPRKVRESILETYKELTGKEGVFEINDTFWQETLFIIANYEDKPFNWLNDKANVLVIGEKYNVGAVEYPNLVGFQCYDIGLVPPKMGLARVDRTILKSLSGTTVLKKEREARETLLRRTDVTDGVINFANPFLVRDKDGKISLVGTEKEIKHDYELVRNMTDMVVRVWNGEELTDAVPQVFTDVVDWYSAAVTAEITDGSEEFYSYNIGGHLFIRGAGDNYISYLGLISEMVPKITQEIKENIERLADEVIAETSDDSKFGKKLLEKTVAHLKAKFSIKFVSGDDSAALFLSDAVSPLATDPDNRPSYEKFARQLVGVDDHALTATVRGILGNKVVKANPFVYTLVACLFIAEPARCPQALLPTIMMLDLIERGVVTWSDAIFQTNILTGDAKLDKDIGKALLKFSGSFPMTQKSSYFQAKFMTDHPLGPDRRLMTWVEYKSSIIMFNWLQLSLERYPARPVSDDVYWDGEIFSRFSDRLANFNMLGLAGYGINPRADFETFERMEGRLQALPEGQRKYGVFAVRKGQKLPVYDVATATATVTTLEKPEMPVVFSDESTLDYASSSSDESLIARKPVLVKSWQSRITLERGSFSAVRTDYSQYHRCTIYKPIAERKELTRKVTEIDFSKEARLVAYRDSRTQYLINKEKGDISR